MVKPKLRIKRLKTQNLTTTEEIKEKIFYIQNVALQLKWRIAAYYPRSLKLTLERDDVKVVIDLVKNNVVTTMQHPSYSKPTKLKREELELREIATILFNPRIHTGKGKYVRHKKKKLW